MCVEQQPQQQQQMQKQQQAPLAEEDQWAESEWACFRDEQNRYHHCHH